MNTYRYENRPYDIPYLENRPTFLEKFLFERWTYCESNQKRPEAEENE